MCMFESYLNKYSLGIQRIDLGARVGKIPRFQVSYCQISGL